MPEIIAKTRNHLLVEVLTGGKYEMSEAYYCIKCTKTIPLAWYGPGPQNEDCEAGDLVVDRSALKRQPVKDPRNELISNDSPPVPGTILAPMSVTYPLLWVVSGNAKAIEPFIFTLNGSSGFVLASNQVQMECTRSVLLQTYAISTKIRVIRITGSEGFDQMLSVASRCEDRIRLLFFDIMMINGSAKMSYRAIRIPNA